MTEIEAGDRVAVTFTGTVLNRAPGFLVEIGRDNDPKPLWFYDYAGTNGVALTKLAAHGNTSNEESDV